MTLAFDLYLVARMLQMEANCEGREEGMRQRNGSPALGSGATDLSVGRAALADNSPVPPSVVVKVQNHPLTLAESLLNEGVERLGKVRIEGAPELRRRSLPSEGQATDIGARCRKVIDLRDRRGNVASRLAAVGVDAKVEAGEVDAVELRMSCRDERGRGESADEELGDGHGGWSWAGDDGLVGKKEGTGRLAKPPFKPCTSRS